MPKIYIGMTVDILHHGHINIIERAREYGDVIIGLLTDSAVSAHKRLPYLKYEYRRKILENIQGVKEVVPQNEWDYSYNIKKYKPEFMIHGDDWKEGSLAKFRQRAIEELDKYGGKLIEIPYTQGINSSEIASYLRDIESTPENRRSKLTRMLQSKSFIRVIEAHSPISALIAEKTVIMAEEKRKEFDCFWSSSLTDSSQMGKPDIELLDLSSRLTNINNIFEVTTKPLIMDFDTGGKVEHFELNIKTIERLGVSAVIIEDKRGLKKNSLLGNDVYQEQESIEIFCEKIRAGRSSVNSKDFMIIARIESLILDKGLDDALNRAYQYVDAGANAIMIHSRSKLPDEVFLFSNKFKSKFPNVPIVAVPTSYSHINESELIDNGINIVIYANHLFRAAYPAMHRVAEQILIHGRAKDIEDDLISIKEVLKLIPGTI